MCRTYATPRECTIESFCLQMHAHARKMNIDSKKGEKVIEQSFPYMYLFVAAHHKEIITHHRWIYLFLALPCTYQTHGTCRTYPPTAQFIYTQYVTTSIPALSLNAPLMCDTIHMPPCCDHNQPHSGDVCWQHCTECTGDCNGKNKQFNLSNASVAC